MNNEDDRPVHVTAEERGHPAIRTLARACIALARMRLEKEATEEPTFKEDDVQEAADD
jgi:hypothetical protein